MFRACLKTELYFCNNKNLRTVFVKGIPIKCSKFKLKGNYSGTLKLAK